MGNDLTTKGSHVSISAFNNLTVELVWTTAVDLDLVVFYKTRDGHSGGVYSEHYSGGTRGNLAKAPFIELSADAGLGASGGDNREVLKIARLDHFEQLCVCALNYTGASSNDGAGVWKDYDARVEVKTDGGQAFRVVLDSAQPGPVAMICKLLPTFLGSDLVNKSQIMTLEALRQAAPGASAFEVSKTASPSP